MIFLEDEKKLKFLTAGLGMVLNDRQGSIDQAVSISRGPIFSPWIPDDSSILTEKSRTDLFEDFLNFDGPLRNHLFIGMVTSILSIHMTHDS